MTTTLSPTEINRRVAEICGLEFTQGLHGTVFTKEPAHDFSVPFGPRRIRRWLFEPMTERRDAEWAAEKVGGVETERTEDLRWVATAGGYGAVADELPAALCLAILALKENQT